jgi:hypothetical protein
MLNGLIALASIQFFEGALPEAAFWGRLALTVGIIGFLGSLIFVLAHLRDQLSLKNGREQPGRYRPPKWGPLNRSLGEFFDDPLNSAPLSPDAASEYITGRLDAEHEFTQSAIRYSSYAPLLLGLMGTTLSLRSLLTAGGRTLQDIQPLLSGVFAGTLGGIAGSLIAAIGGLVLDRVALSSGNKAQDFVHRFILPLLPERRIAVRIEEAVLAIIAERAQAVAETFRSSLGPVAAQMEEVASQSAKAAEEATKAFAEAARALREAGNLEAASRSFKTGAHMIDSSAEQLSDATKQTAEVILRLGEVRTSLTEVLDHLQVTADGLVRANEQASDRVAEQVKDLTANAREAQSAAAVLHSSVEDLRSELVRRADLDTTRLEAINAETQEVRTALTALAQVAREIADSVQKVTSSAESISKAGEALQQKVSSQIQDATGQLAGAVEKMSAILERSPAPPRNEVMGPRTVRLDSNGLGNIIREAVQEMRRFSDQARVLNDAVREMKVLQPDGAEPKVGGLITRIGQLIRGAGRG